MVIRFERASPGFCDNCGNKGNVVDFTYGRETVTDNESDHYTYQFTEKQINKFCLGCVIIRTLQFITRYFREKP
jgi:hypothetical protein